MEGVNENSELAYVPTASRSAHINAAAAGTLAKYISAQIAQAAAAWSLGFPSSGFASTAWNQATGQNLDPTQGGVYDDPTSLQNAINTPNGGWNRAISCSDLGLGQAWRTRAERPAFLGDPIVAVGCDPVAEQDLRKLEAQGGISKGMSPFCFLSVSNHDLSGLCGESSVTAKELLRLTLDARH